MWNGFLTVSGNRAAGRDVCTRRACRAWSGKDPQDLAPAGSQDRLWKAFLGTLFGSLLVSGPGE